MKNYDVIIVGAGPAGIFTAIELLRKSPDKRVLMVDMGTSIDHEVGRQHLVNLARLVAQLVLLQRQYRALVRSQRRMQVQHYAGVAALKLLLLISVAQKRQHQSLNAYRRLYAGGYERLARGGVEVFQALARMLAVLLQIVIGAIGHAPLRIVPDCMIVGLFTVRLLHCVVSFAKSDNGGKY